MDSSKSNPQTWIQVVRQHFRHRIQQKVYRDEAKRSLDLDTGWGQVAEIYPKDVPKTTELPSHPLIFRGLALQWPCAKWSLNYFSKHYGNKMAIAGPRFQEMSLKQIIDLNNEGKKVSAKFFPLTSLDPHLTEDFNLPWLRKFEQRDTFFRCWQFFLTAQQSVTYTHCANGCNLFVQLEGRKTWWIFSPKFIRNIEFERGDFHWNSSWTPWQSQLSPEDIYRVDLKPGDVLWNPAYWWHYVATDTTSLSVGYRWVSLKHCLQMSPLMTALDFMSGTSPIRQKWRDFKNSNEFKSNYYNFQHRFRKQTPDRSLSQTSP